METLNTIASCRETLFSALSKSRNLQHILKVSTRTARDIEVRALLASSSLSRRHKALQSSLATATFLGHLVKPCQELGLKIDVAVKYEESSVLWDQGEMAASIRVLKDIIRESDLKSQDIRVGKPELLAKLVCPTFSLSRKPLNH